MSLSCIFGLTACLNYGVSAIPAEDAILIGDKCDFARQIASSEFDGPTGMGIVVGESLEKLGLEFEWVKGGAARKREILFACQKFDAAFDNRSSWSNLDKWPY